MQRTRDDAATERNVGEVPARSAARDERRNGDGVRGSGGVHAGAANARSREHESERVSVSACLLESAIGWDGMGREVPLS
jgi:hypothetical protein